MSEEQDILKTLYNLIGNQSDVECPYCKKDKLKSKIFVGNRLSTLMGYDAHNDIDGNIHYHDPNRTKCYYKCSNGHEFHETIIKYCWCGWYNNGK